MARLSEDHHPRRRGLIGATRQRFKGVNATLLAAALTYFGILAVIPGLAVVVSLLGLFGHHVVTQVVQKVQDYSPGSSAHLLHTLLVQAQRHRTGAGVTAIVGALIALWSASGYVNGFRQASNALYGVGEGRPVWKTAPLRLAVTALSVVLIVAAALIVVVTGPIADQVGQSLGVGHGARLAWEILKWPVLAVIVTVLLAVLFRASPNAQTGGSRWWSPGGLLAMVLWVVVSALFATYVTLFASYNRTYGSLAGIVVFLVWLWLNNIALLAGAALNAELDHVRSVEAGLPPDVEPFREPRDTKKLSGRQRAELEEARASGLGAGAPSAGGHP